jgi:hypothetical protein
MKSGGSTESGDTDLFKAPVDLCGEAGLGEALDPPEEEEVLPRRQPLPQDVELPQPRLALTPVPPITPFFHARAVQCAIHKTASACTPRACTSARAVGACRCVFARMPQSLPHTPGGTRPSSAGSGPSRSSAPPSPRTPACAGPVRSAEHICVIIVCERP